MTSVIKCSNVTICHCDNIETAKEVQKQCETICIIVLNLGFAFVFTLSVVKSQFKFDLFYFSNQVIRGIT